MKHRDAEATRERILSAAREEFAVLGLGGARIDKIAETAGANKQMIYHYFGSKDLLFTAALEAEYAQFRAAEAELELDRLEPVEALKALVAFTWRYYLEFPGFVPMVNSANLHKARHLVGSKVIRETSGPFIARMSKLLARGAASGVFRSGIDPVQLQITIAGLGYHYLTNRFTGAIVYERDLMSPKALRERLAFNLDTVLRLVCTPKALARMEHLECTA
jgi:AcrR family transcriptional regulator